MSETGDTTFDPHDWINATEAAKLVPPARGKRTHTSTIIRLIHSGRLEGRKRGHYYFVRRQDVIELLEPLPSKEPGGQVPQKPPPMRASDRAILKRAGLL